jgi:hypothetical protein
MYARNDNIHGNNNSYRKDVSGRNMEYNCQYERLNGNKEYGNICKDNNDRTGKSKIIVIKNNNHNINSNGMNTDR